MSSDSVPRPKLLAMRDQMVVIALVAVGIMVLAINAIFARFVFVPADLDALPKRPAEFTVNVNAAGWPELAQLPGVGETLARRIIESRNHDGPFDSPAALRRVNGIGRKTLRNIAPYLRFDATAPATDLPPATSAP